MQKYSEFKKFFEGDSKLNIVALDKNDNVLIHRAIVCDGIIGIDVVNDILKGLKIELKKKRLASQIYKYEITYPKI